MGVCLIESIMPHSVLTIGIGRCKQKYPVKGVQSYISQGELEWIWAMREGNLLLQFQTHVIGTAIHHTDHCTFEAIVQGKTVSVSCLFCYPLNRLELKQWSSGFVGIGSHRHSADARQPGWIDLIM